MATTPNYNLPLPNSRGIQIAEMEKVAGAITGIDTVLDGIQTSTQTALSELDDATWKKAELPASDVGKAVLNADSEQSGREALGLSNIELHKLFLMTSGAYGSATSDIVIDDLLPGDFGLYNSGLPGSPYFPGVNFWWIETQQIYGDRHKRQIATSYRTGEDAEPVVMARVTNADGVYGPWRRFAMETDLPKLVSVGSEQNFTLAEKARGRANIDALGSSDRGAANGVASLGSDGKVPSGQLPALTTTATVGAAMAGANSKATPADGDFFAGVQAGGSTMFKTTWANIKTALASVFLRLTGGTLTGFLTLHSAPTANMHAANKGYVDTGLNDKLALSGGTLTGALSGTTISLSGGMSGSLTHRSGGGYMNIGSFNEGTYGSGYCRAWCNENDNTLAFTATDGDAIVKSEYFQTTRQPTDVSHLTRKDYVDNLVNARVSNVRRVGPSSVSSITKGGSWDAPSGYFVTGLSYALEGAAIGLRSYQPQVYINGAWRAFA